jgi:hypothetical protein
MKLILAGINADLSGAVRLLTVGSRKAGPRHRRRHRSRRTRPLTDSSSNHAAVRHSSLTHAAT